MQLANLPSRIDPMLDVGSTAITPARVLRAKAGYTTRRVDLSKAELILTGEIAPRAGDLVLARVERIGQHGRIELAHGRRAHLHVGDEIIVTYGARYAPDQFEAYVPGDLGRCDLVAAGGLASACMAKHGRMKNPTRIQPLGLLAYGSGLRVCLSDWALPKARVAKGNPLVFAVVGTMMNAGKTTCAASLVQGFKQQGLRVGAAKVTGTGAGGDRWVLTDAGADIVLDFTDMGEPSTFKLSAGRVREIFTGLTDHLVSEGVDAIVLEVADGLFQRETADLLNSDVFRGRCDGLLFAAGDALGALAGVRHLDNLGHKVLAVGGAMTASPLATREARDVIDIRIVTSEDLATARWLPQRGPSAEESSSAVIDLPQSWPNTAGDGNSAHFVKWINGGTAAQSGS